MKKKYVLVVESDADIASMIGDNLSEIGIEMKWAYCRDTFEHFINTPDIVGATLEDVSGLNIDEAKALLNEKFIPSEIFTKNLDRVDGTKKPGSISAMLAQLNDNINDIDKLIRDYSPKKVA
jgi:hypothetical protein